MGSPKTLCDGLTRRDLLHVGGLGALGLSLADGLRLEASQPLQTQTPYFGRAKRCILLFLFGSPPQHETFDPKPAAPREIQGELGAIGTTVSGIQIGEGLPKVAQVMDRITVVRSMTHPYPVHGVAYALSGMPTYTPAIEAMPRAAEHWPFVGSVVDYADERAHGGAVPPLPRNVGLPWVFGSKSTLPTLAGPYAAFLGQAHDPVWTDFDGLGSTIVPKLTDVQTEEVFDPFAGVSAAGRFRLSDSGGASADVSAERLGQRRSLLAQFDDARREFESDSRIHSFDKYRQVAWSLIASNRTREAIDVSREPIQVRERYGMTLFGQAALAARRLAEAGGRFISVFWDPFGPFGGSCWDTHANHFPRLKEYLLPVFDQTYSALIADLDQRGLLDETLVLCISEHGRTPQIDSKPKGGGRHHWSRVYSAALAGGGICRGKVVGRSDAHGGDVNETPVSPKDLLATTLCLLGIDPDTLVADLQGRPLRVAGDGEVRTELLA
ncbi:MAG TPA: DUF1501 domain-containing protein [Pirellulales bacterium]|nr:DUF1501 domain-containing protein [Pirellulales bacterium]